MKGIARSVFLLMRNHAPHSTARIIDTAVPTGNKVNVGMKNRLAGTGAEVEADIEAGNG